ncbi:50S ribosomal protein L22 [Candidatus Woesearchaeota archaeon]|nr:50S ribosomal protein L22 [Candidatus Woesearchaeota archaeon]
MADYKYAYNASSEDKEKLAYAVGRDLDISIKDSIMICEAIRHKSSEGAERILKQAIDMKQPIAFTRFTNGLGHRSGKGMASGRYPVKACTRILSLLKSAEANAENKGLGKLRVEHIRASKGSDQWHFGRLRRRKMKRTHIEIVLKEVKSVAKADKKPVKQKSAKQVKKDVKQEIRSEIRQDKTKMELQAKKTSMERKTKSDD